MLSIDILHGGTNGFHKVGSQFVCQADYFGTSQGIVLTSVEVISSCRLDQYQNITMLENSSLDGLSLDENFRKRFPDVISLAMIHSDNALTGHKWASSSGNGYR
jgi:hypothetical protein